MIFNEISFYLLFLIPCALLFYKVPKSFRSWVLMTFGVGFFCYYSFTHFGEFWGIATVLIFVVETLVSRLYKKGSRWCIYGIVQAVVILGIFKYLYFFSQVWNDSMMLIGSENFIGVKKLILPLGISFFTFEFVHFAYDVYTGKIKEAELKEYGAFIFFFPCMVAGPIKRFNDFVVGIRRDDWDYSLVTQGITRICLGLMKKHVFADTLSLFSDKLLTDALYQDSGLAIYGYIMAYAFKVYIDFSAYSDIAIGCGNVFNFRIPENFNWPYISKNIAEFWRRWHISLMSWFVDYIYNPMVFSGFLFKGWTGFKRDNIIRLVIITNIIFFISGLWHGADYNFIVFGVMHGIMTCIYLTWRNFKLHKKFPFPAALNRLITFSTATLSLGMFCMPIDRALYAYKKIFMLL